jgi:hypothetical protein
MAATDPKLYSAPARHGAYLPLKYAGDGAWVTPDFPRGECFGSPANFSASDIVHINVDPGFIQNRVKMLNQYFVPVTWLNDNWVKVANFPDPISDPVVVPPDTGFDEWGTGVILFRGLDPAATITIRVHDVIEQVPAATSPFRPFVKPPILHSPKALMLYSRVQQASPNAYPASFNSWGKVWDVIKDIAREVWPVAKAVAPIVVRAIDKTPDVAAAIHTRPPQVAQVATARAKPRGKGKARSKKRLMIKS